MLYLVSSSSFRGSVSKMFFNPLFIHGPFSNPPSPPIFFSTFRVCLCSWFCSHQENIFKGTLMIVLTYAALVQIFCYLEWPQMELPFWIKNQLQPQRAPTVEGTSGALHSFFTVQILHRSSLIAVNQFLMQTQPQLWMPKSGCDISGVAAQVPKRELL